MFDTNIARQGATTTVEVLGDVDISTQDTLGSALDGAIAGEPEVLVVDLSRVTMMDSYGFAVLVGIRNELQESSTELVIGPRSAPVARLFQLRKLADAFRFDPPLA